MNSIDPQLKSILTSVLMGVATSAAAWATAHNVIPGADQATLANDLVAAALWAVTAGIAWFKARQHTPVAQIAAVNNAPNGLKVVKDTVAAPAETEPAK